MMSKNCNSHDCLYLCQGLENCEAKTKHYKCDECGTEQKEYEMRREYDFGYDQSCCVKCGHVLIDNLHGNIYAKEIKPS